MVSKAKKQVSTQKSPKVTTYLREVEIRYRKRKVTDKVAVGKPISGARQVVNLFADLQNETKEKLIAVSLDAGHKILCFEVVAMGSIAEVAARPFEIIRASVAVNAAALILVHNHPSGNTDPSPSDKSMTKDMKKLTKLGGMNFLDHIIIGEDEYYSIAEDGKL